MYSWSPNLSQISLKNSFGKVVFQILAEIEMTGYLMQLSVKTMLCKKKRKIYNVRKVWFFFV